MGPVKIVSTGDMVTWFDEYCQNGSRLADKTTVKIRGKETGRIHIASKPRK